MAEEVTKKLQLLGKIWGAVNALKTGKVGQLIRVSAVDENGGITALEAVDDAKELPEVTADDNGKVLTLVDGAWTPKAVEIPEPSVATEVDLSAYESDGKIVETFADGTSKTTTVEFDADGNPVKITDGDGNITTLTW